jgi:phosphinothricin acetyltransferase
MNIRRATEADAEQVADLLNYYVLNTTATFHHEPLSVESQREWAASQSDEHPRYVIEDNGRILGLAGLKAFRPRAAYARTVENSVYLLPDEQGKGYGSLLLHVLTDQARKAGHHAIIAVICPEQEASIRLHQKFGFAEVGRLKEVGRKFDRWLDSVYMELVL